MSSKKELTVREEENPMHLHWWSFAIVSWVMSNTTKCTIQLIGVSNECGRCVHAWRIFLIETVRWRKNKLCISVPVLAFLEATICMGPTDIQTPNARRSSVDAIQTCTKNKGSDTIWFYNLCCATWTGPEKMGLSNS